MFVSVLMTSTSRLEKSDSSSYLDTVTELERVKKNASKMQSELTEMKRKLAVAESATGGKNIRSAAVPGAVLSTKIENTIESRITRPGVIILGMHRSGGFKIYPSPCSSFPSIS